MTLSNTAPTFIIFLGRLELARKQRYLLKRY